MFVEADAEFVAALISFQPTRITTERFGAWQTILKRKAAHIFLTFAHFFTLFLNIFKIRIHEQQSVKEKISFWSQTDQEAQVEICSCLNVGDHFF